MVVAYLLHKNYALHDAFGEVLLKAPGSLETT